MDTKIQNIPIGLVLPNELKTKTQLLKVNYRMLGHYPHFL